MWVLRVPWLPWSEGWGKDESRHKSAWQHFAAAVCLRGCSPLGDRVSVNSQSGEGRRHDLSLSVPETCVDEAFTHSRVFSQKGKNKKKKRGRERETWDSFTWSQEWRKDPWPRHHTRKAGRFRGPVLQAGTAENTGQGSLWIFASDLCKYKRGTRVVKQEK